MDEEMIIIDQYMRDECTREIQYFAGKGTIVVKYEDGVTFIGLYPPNDPMLFKNPREVSVVDPFSSTG